ncbi:MAG: DUF433 domain-containing protein [Candidatus Brocadiaceae bacterium]|nr:DUF433 domain-containing protein [Candidatus Brocadiaceae bacterium]
MPAKRTRSGKGLEHPYITIDPRIAKGSPVISGTRIRVIDIAIEYDRIGLTPDQIIDVHPHLTLEAIHDALSYYYEKRNCFDAEIKNKIKVIENIAGEKPSILKKARG